MRRQKNDKVQTIFVYALIVMAIAAAFLCLLLNFDVVWNILSSFILAFRPIIYAVIFVFCVGGLVRSFEKLFTKLFVKGKKTAVLCKVLSVTLGYLVFLIIIALLAVIVVLPIVNSYSEIFASVPVYLENASKWIEGTLRSIPIISEQSDKIMQHINDSLNISYDSISKYAPIAMGWLNKLISEASSMLLGLIISIYMICSLSYIERVKNRLVHAFISDEKAERAHNAIEAVKGYFSDHFSGRVLYCLVIGMIFYVVMWIMGIPFYSFLSTMIGILGFVPVIGTLTGFGISLFFVFVTKYEMALWYIICYIAITAFGFLFLQKKIIKESARPSVTASLASVLIMQGFFGTFGAVLAIPVYLSIKYLFFMALEMFEEKKAKYKEKKEQQEDEEDDL